MEDVGERDLVTEVLEFEFDGGVGDVVDVGLVWEATGGEGFEFGFTFVVGGG